MAVSTWEPSELDKQTQIAQQATARIAELEAKVKWYAGVVMDYTAVLERAEQAEARCKELEAENANFESGARCDRDEIEGLKAERDALRHARLPCREAEVAQRRYEQAEAELDALRQGCTCANFNGHKQDCKLDLSPCHHHVFCHFTPSRWAERSTL